MVRVEVFDFFARRQSAEVKAGLRSKTISWGR